MLDVLAIIRRVLKKSFSCFDWLVLSKPAASFDKLRTNGWFVEGLSTNGKSSMFSALLPFALSPSKGERRVFQQPAGALSPSP